MSRPVGAYAQTIRCVRLLRWLEEQTWRVPISLDVVAAQFATTARTVRRDAAALIEAGEPLQLKDNELRMLTELEAKEEETCPG